MNNNIKIDEFDALIRITVEMSKYLYPYIREILKSKENLEENSVIWNDFNNRFIELIKERFNVCLLYTSPSPRDVEESRMPSSA